MSGETPKRVVSLVPSMTESLFEMGLGQLVVGVTDYCIFPADKVRGVKKVGGPKSVNLQAVCELHPDLILANQEENKKEEIGELLELGKRVVVFFPKSVSESLEDLYTVGRMFHDASVVRAVQWLEKTVDWMRLTAHDERHFRYFCPIWQGRSPDGVSWWMTFNGETYSSDLLSLFGGVNCFADRQRKYPLEADLGLVEAVNPAGRDVRFPRLTREEIIAAAPDVILLPSEPFPYTNRHLKHFYNLFSDTPAATHENVVPVDGTWINWHGVRIAHAIRELPAILKL